MDFEDSPEEAAFRAEVRSWLDANAKPRVKREASDPMDERSDPVAMKKAREWQKTKADKGYARITWPKGMGGIAGTPMQSIIFGQEESKYDVPAGAPFAIGLGMCIPTVMAYCGDETKARYVKPAVEGDGNLVPAVLRTGGRLRRRGACAPRRKRTATPGRSTDRRSGRPARNSPITDCCSRAPTRMCPSTRV